jgi:1-deoxy-D-xylulose-5-phosphate synthase
VALQKLQVVFCLDRGGLVGADGATHHGAYDLAYFRCIPNMIVSAPLNEEDLRDLMYTAQAENHGPFSIRYPRGNGSMVDWKTPFKKMKIGEGKRLKNGNDVAILSIGAIGTEAIKAIEVLEKDGLSIAHYDMRFVKPIDELLLHEVFAKFDKVITLEDGCVMGGMGSAVLEFMADNNYKATVKRLGVPDKFVEHGSQNELYNECFYNVDAIVKTVKSMVQQSLNKALA